MHSIYMYNVHVYGELHIIALCQIFAMQIFCELADSWKQFWLIKGLLAMQHNILGVQYEGNP